MAPRSSRMVLSVSLIWSGSSPLVGSSRIRIGGSADSASASTALPVALRERADEAVADFPDLALGEAVVDAGREPARSTPLSSARIRGTLNAHFGIERHASGQVADALADLHRLIHHVEAAQPSIPAGRGSQVVRMRIQVDFPAPLGPRNPTSSPGSPETTSSTARTGP